MNLPTNTTRRMVLAAGPALLARPVQAFKDKATDVYRRSVVLDGNLIASSLLDPGVIDARTAARIQGSGLTAFKQTLGGGDGAFVDTQTAITALKAAIARNAALFTQIRSADEIAAAKRQGKTGVIFSFESASMLEGRLDRITDFSGQGVRVMGLSYNVGSVLGGGALQGETAQLTPLGREAVSRMNSLGVTIDISHSNEATGLEAVAVSKGPILITHAGCAAVHPHPRNKSDRLLRAVAASGGVTGIFDLSYLGGYPAHPTLNMYLAHLTHALDVCGEDHVGVGSDSFLLGMDTSPAAQAAADHHEAQRRAAGLAAPEELAIPFVAGLNGPDRWDIICSALLRRGYKARTVEKVLGANFVRVFAETWRLAT